MLGYGHRGIDVLPWGTETKVLLKTYTLLSLSRAIVELVSRRTSELVYAPPSCHFSVDVGRSLVRRVTHVCNCSGVPDILPRLRIDVSCSSATSLARRVGLTLIGGNCVRTVDFDFDSTGVRTLLSSGTLKRILTLTGPVSDSLTIVHHALLSDLLPYMRCGLGQRRPHIHFFRANLDFINRDVDRLMRAPDVTLITINSV